MVKSEEERWGELVKMAEYFQHLWDELEADQLKQVCLYLKEKQLDIAEELIRYIAESIAGSSNISNIPSLEPSLSLLHEYVQTRDHINYKKLIQLIADGRTHEVYPDL